MNKISDIALTVTDTFDSLVNDPFLRNYVLGLCNDVWSDAYTHFNNTNVVSYVKRWARLTNDRLSKYTMLSSSGATKTTETTAVRTASSIYAAGDATSKQFIYPDGFIGGSDQQQLQSESLDSSQDDNTTINNNDNTIVNENDALGKLDLSFEQYMDICLYPDKMMSGLIAGV